MRSQTRAASERPAFIRPAVSRLLILGLRATVSLSMDIGGSDREKAYSFTR